MISNAPPHFESIELVLTYRCNLTCPNCIRLAGKSGTDLGLRNQDQDMDLKDVERVVTEIQRIGNRIAVRPLVGFVCLTGGEATLNKNLEAAFEMCDRGLVKTGLTTSLFINSNGTVPPPPSLLDKTVTFSTPQQKLQGHIAMFCDIGGTSFERCTHYRKWRIVAAKQGFLMCCAAEGYARLMGRDDLWSKHLPTNPWNFPLEKMWEVCSHCAFCKEGNGAPLESAVGSPMSPFFQQFLKQRQEPQSICLICNASPCDCIRLGLR